MAKKEFSKKIAGKTVKIYPATHSSLSGEAWGAQALCPFCGETRRTMGASTPKMAAQLVFNSIEVHIKRDHKKNNG